MSESPTAIASLDAEGISEIDDLPEFYCTVNTDDIGIEVHEDSAPPEFLKKQHRL